MKTNTGPRRHNPVIDSLKKLYRRHLGELAWIEAPPKTMARKSRDRDSFEAATPDRARRAVEIRGDLPHLAHVIRIYDPEWDEAAARPIRPKAKNKATPKPQQGWALAALTVLRDAAEPLTMADVVSIICDKYDIAADTVFERQRFHTAVNNALRRNRHNRLLIKHEGQPTRWSLQRG